ncbi:hypothetical protein ILUMI_15888 [Ignelater luminosus]|uniref:2'-phosphotransferase n=1 Tax=Ignelater luminosus TaxID=2038154 RepID=A0A8K0CPL5_IGNLU|nr:hypothetical protein ILUMI_15888 [Ignelater luminosus]
MQRRTTFNTKHDIWISKTLSGLLRHRAIKEGLTISSEGFVPIAQILNNRYLKSKCTIDDIKRIVVNNDKQRFTLRTTETGELEIRANQGHSIPNLDNLELTPITNANQVENVIHGTYFKFWNSIKTQGLYRGKRNHIHFASGLLGNTNVISGIRKTVEIYIYIDLQKALSSGFLFFLSTNGLSCK